MQHHKSGGCSECSGTRWLPFVNVSSAWFDELVSEGCAGDSVRFPPAGTRQLECPMRSHKENAHGSTEQTIPKSSLARSREYKPESCPACWPDAVFIVMRGGDVRQFAGDGIKVIEATIRRMRVFSKQFQPVLSKVGAQPGPNKQGWARVSMPVDPGAAGTVLEPTCVHGHVLPASCCSRTGCSFRLPGRDRIQHFRQNNMAA